MESAGRVRNLVICALLATAVWLVYGQVISFDFVRWDDTLYVDNAWVQRGLSTGGFRWALTADSASNWHPLTWLSHMLDWQIYGPNAGGHHASNVLFHMLNSLLLFGTLRFMTHATWPSAFVAGLFALHPLNTECVAHVAQRKAVLSTTLGLGSLWAYAAYARNRGASRYLLSAALLALGLSAKPTLVTLPLVFLLLDYWPLERTRLSKAADRGEPFVRLLAEKVPLLALSALSIAVTLSVQHGAVEAAEPVPIPLRAANALVSYADFLGKAFWPSDLAMLYPHPYMFGGPALAAWQVAGALVLVAAISLLAVWSRRPYAIVGWLWFLGTLVPTIGLVQVGGQGLADRYAYVPLIGLGIVVSFGVADLVGRLRARSVVVGRSCVVGAAAVLTVLAVCSWFQARTWRDSFALFERALQVEPRNPIVLHALAGALGAQGRWDEAIEHYRRALELRPDHAPGHYNLGTALKAEGQLDEAIRHYQRALELGMNDSRVHNNLANALQEGGEPDLALKHYRRAVFFGPGNAQAHSNLGGLLFKRGELDEAVLHYQQALAVAPDFVNARYALAVVLASRGEVDEAIDQYRLVVQARPEHASAHFNLGIALQERGELDQAIHHYRQALAARPRHARTHNNLGTAFEARGDLEQAIPYYRKAVELDSGYEKARKNLDDALHAMGPLE